jgi:methylphosphotriester-DNA--protein-cysteine methyltransferase
MKSNERIARVGHDPVVNAVLQGHPQEMSSRTVRHRFLRATGLSQSHIYQVERAQRAAALLRQRRFDPRHRLRGWLFRSAASDPFAEAMDRTYACPTRQYEYA